MVRLRALRALIHVADLKSFRRAAAHLHTTQPAISARIRGLEEHFQRKLIHRDARGIRLTAEGIEVLRYAKSIVELTDRVSHLFQPTALIAGTVRIGAIDTVVPTFLMPLFERLRREHPEVSFELRTDTSLNLIEDLRRGEVDVALLMGPVEDEAVVNLDLGTFPMAWVANPRRYPFAHEIDVTELARYPIISYPRGSKPYRMIERYFEAQAPNQVRLSSSNSLSTLIRLAVDGFGIAAIPPAVIERELAEGQLARIPVRQPFPGLECHAVYYAASRSAAPALVAELAHEEAERYWRTRSAPQA